MATHNTSYGDDSAQKLLESPLTDSPNNSKNNNDSANTNASNISNSSLNEVRETSEIGKAKKKFFITKHLNEDVLNSPKSLADEKELYPLMQHRKKSTATKSASLSKLETSSQNQQDGLFEQFDQAKSGSVNSQRSVDTPILSNKLGSNDTDLNRENEDVFDLEDINHVNAAINDNSNNNRYAEGQDTITSLKSSVFTKQLAEIRRKASLRSNKSTSSSINSINAPSNTNINKDSTTTPAKNLPFTKLFYKSQDSVKSATSKKSISKHNTDQSKEFYIDTINQEINNITNDLNTSSGTINTKSKPHIAFKRLSSTQDKATGDNSIIQTAIANNPEVLLDKINDVIKSNDIELSQQLIKRVKDLIAEADYLEKRRRRYFKRIFKLIACFFLMFTLLMGIIVITSVFLQIQRIESNRLYTRNLTNSSYFFTNNNNTFIKFVDNFLSSRQGM